MQLITTRNKEISFAELKKAISSGNGLELIRPGDKFTEDCLADKWRMNDTPTNKGGYLKSEGR